jgi:membrane protease YdiL (CAAX protease family)
MDEVKQAKKVFSRLGWCYIAGTALVYLLQIILTCVIQVFKPEWLNNLNITLILSSIIIYACGMPLIVLLTRNMDKTAIEHHKMKWWQFVLALIMCYALVYVSNLLGTIVTEVVGAFKGSSVGNSLLDYVTGGNMLVNFVLMVMIAPAVEEYVFRKVIVDRTVRYGQGMAIAASGLMFGLFHGNLNQFAYAVVLGAFFAFLYVKTGNLKITIGMHAIVNFMGSVVAGQIVKLLHYDELLAVDSSDMDAVMEVVMNNLGGWIIYMIYALLLFVVVITGIILLIVFRKRFRLEPGQTAIPKGKKFSTLIVNPGMLVFCAAWMVLIIIQLLS